MKEILLQVDEKKYQLLLTFLSTLDYVHVKKTTDQVSQAMEEPATYRLSDLSGKLSWKGDAMAEQRKLRDEW